MDNLPLFEELVRSAESAVAPAVSLYLPTERAGRETRQGAKILRNLVRDVREQAAASGSDERVLEQVLAPARSLIADESFWQHQRDGLALLLWPGTHLELRLPFRVPEFASCGEDLHLKPLLPLAEHFEYRLLALSQNRVRLFRGSRWGLALAPSDAMPSNMTEALAADDPQKQLQHHSFRVPHGLRAVFHGQGGGSSDERHEQDLARYLRAVDDVVCASTEGEPTPLVLACVAECAAAYREVSKYSDVVAEPIAGNSDDATEGSLHEAAWRLLAPRLEARRDAAVADLRSRSGTGLATDDLGAVATAAHNGRVESLFVVVDASAWGRPSDGVEPPEVHAARIAGDVELLDRAVVDAIRHGGRVFAVDRAVTGPDGVAATLRY